VRPASAPPQLIRGGGPTPGGAPSYCAVTICRRLRSAAVSPASASAGLVAWNRFDRRMGVIDVDRV